MLPESSPVRNFQAPLLIFPARRGASRLACDPMHTHYSKAYLVIPAASPRSSRCVYTVGPHYRRGPKSLTTTLRTFSVAGILGFRPKRLDPRPFDALFASRSWP